MKIKKGDDVRTLVDKPIENKSYKEEFELDYLCNDLYGKVTCVRKDNAYVEIGFIDFKVRAKYKLSELVKDGEMES